MCVFVCVHLSLGFSVCANVHAYIYACAHLPSSATGTYTGLIKFVKNDLFPNNCLQEQQNVHLFHVLV